MWVPWTGTQFRVAVSVNSVTGLTGRSSHRGLCSSTCPASNSPSLNLSFITTPTRRWRRRPRISPSPLLLTTHLPLATTLRPSSSSSASSRWKLRQGADPFARSARVQGLKSRAAFKLLELDSKYHLFRRGKGQVVVDLGYAPGSWSQVALDRTAPNGTVVGIDIIPAQPPRGVSTIQGNFLSPGVQAMVKQFLLEGAEKRRVEKRTRGGAKGEEGEEEEEADEVADRPSYIDLERMAAQHESEVKSGVSSSGTSSSSTTPSHDDEGGTPSNDGGEKRRNLRLVDV
ncbi:hypothetical protein N658DRAFT_497720 [Parathielavia hyrcaniae]|uniref:rRNA methyltransferase 2, mitochondrial n=1 Tax=Parathielavia hyrcaniae TaxID=113614 RepID=A0AAN6PY72_9PEZI|nr:hypothetical protein N658DRAFT_497720 [Parathielavia hyrcaniae]